ncbi:hypothetical protein MTO96_001637 [Rhipicephalus appendiculatus]
MDRRNVTLMKALPVPANGVGDSARAEGAALPVPGTRLPGHLRVAPDAPHAAGTSLHRGGLPRILRVRPSPTTHTWALFNSTREVEILREYVAQLNQAQMIHNLELFGPLQPDDPVIVIQVHNRWHYLVALIDSLRTARDINRTLVIFSHDEYSPIVESLPYKVDFCKMMQIFLPHSIQLYPNQFPGQDQNDCPRNIKKDDAIKLGCNNALHPDSFGHYREAKFSQTKHHWWWKMNREDHYVTPDFLHVLRLMKAEQQTSQKQCSMLVLGSYAKSFNYHITGNQVEILQWSSSKAQHGNGPLQRSLGHNPRQLFKYVLPL